jgi:hypothetical protein
MRVKVVGNLLQIVGAALKLQVNSQAGPQGFCRRQRADAVGDTVLGQVVGGTEVFRTGFYLGFDILTLIQRGIHRLQQAGGRGGVVGVVGIRLHDALQSSQSAVSDRAPLCGTPHCRRILGLISSAIASDVSVGCAFCKITGLRTAAH